VFTGWNEGTEHRLTQDFLRRGVEVTIKNHSPARSKNPQNPCDITVMVSMIKLNHRKEQTKNKRRSKYKKQVQKNKHRNKHRKHNKQENKNHTKGQTTKKTDEPKKGNSEKEEEKP